MLGTLWPVNYVVRPSNQRQTIKHSPNDLMKKLHRPSGFHIETSVIFYDDIKKYGPGVIIINPSGMKTVRMTTDPTLYNSEEAADTASFEIGKQILSRHLSGEEVLHFDQQ